jgi:hypothetical protein
VTDHTAVGVRVALNTGFHAARARLKILARGGTLLRASEVAYGEGIAGLAELAGPAVGLTRLVGVCLEDLTGTDDCAHIALQWEAIGADGRRPARAPGRAVGRALRRGLPALPTRLGCCLQPVVRLRRPPGCRLSA